MSTFAEPTKSLDGRFSAATSDDLVTRWADAYYDATSSWRTTPLCFEGRITRSNEPSLQKEIAISIRHLKPGIDRLSFSIDGVQIDVNIKDVLKVLTEATILNEADLPSWLKEG